MTALLEQFTPQAKNERWRFSGFAGLTPAQQTLAATMNLAAQQIVAEPGKTLTVTQKLSATQGLSIDNFSIAAQRGATLQFVLINDLPLDAKNFNFLDIIAEASATVHVTLLNFGSAYTRQEVTARLIGRGANIQLRSLTLADADREIDQRTLQLHEAPGTTSNLLFKNVLEGHSRTIFSGLIKVSEAAQKTDAYQKNRNLILSDDAQANSLPGLEIGANDVRCTHGATVGKLAPEELFYLQARGIAKSDAQRLLIGGYCEEILAGLPADVADWARARISGE